MQEYNVLAFIGRFQPFHIGHHKVITNALSRAESVVVLIGSANQPRSYRNPWTWQERAAMIKDSFDPAEAARIKCEPLEDMPYNDELWVEQVQHLVLKNLPGNSDSFFATGMKDYNIGLIGYAKDHTSYYLNLFPTWGSVNVEQEVIYNATDIRNDYFTASPRIPWRILPKGTTDFLGKFIESSTFITLVEEQKYIDGYRKSWANTPYPVTFVTTDAVVVQSGHVLMIERRAAPGKGLMALPGGFLNPKETLEEGMLRELREETKLKVPEPVLRGNIKAVKTFDNPNRSARGRVITQAFLINLPSGPLPKVKGSDDARAAFWVPLATLDGAKCFEDHYHIIRHLTAGL